MKKITLLSLFVFGIMLSTQAQVGLGIKGGLNFANQDYESDGLSVSPDGRTGLHFGAFLVLNLSDNIGLQPELLYSQKGIKFESGGFNIEENFNYIDLPILLRYNINEMISLHAGPQLSFLLSAEDQDGNDFDDEVSGTDLALSFGGQIDLPAGFVGGLRYNLGLSDIYDGPEDPSFSSPEIRNRVFQIYVGWKLFGG